MRPPLDGSGWGWKALVCGTNKHTRANTQRHVHHTDTHTHKHAYTMKQNELRKLIGPLGLRGFMRLVHRPDQTGRTGQDRSSVFLHKLHKLFGLHKLHKLRKPA